jgi:hypothetical protein
VLSKKFHFYFFKTTIVAFLLLAVWALGVECVFYIKALMHTVVFYISPLFYAIIFYYILKQFKVKNDKNNPAVALIKELETFPKLVIVTIILQALFLQYFYFIYLIIFFIVFWDEVLTICLKKLLKYDLPISYNLDKYGSLLMTWKDVFEFFFFKSPKISAFMLFYIKVTKEKSKKQHLQTLFFNAAISRLFLPLNILHLSKNLLLIYKDTIESVVWNQKYKFYWPKLFWSSFLANIPRRFLNKWGLICIIFKQYKLYENNTNGPMWAETSSHLVTTAAKFTTIVTRKGRHVVIDHGGYIKTTYSHSETLVRNGLLVNPSVKLYHDDLFQYGYLQTTPHIQHDEVLLRNFFKNNKIYSQFDALETTHTANLHHSLLKKNDLIIFRDEKKLEHPMTLEDSLKKLSCRDSDIFDCYLKQIKDEYMFFMRKKFPHLTQKALEMETIKLIQFRATIPLNERFNIIYSDIQHSNLPFKEQILEKLMELKNTPFNSNSHI